MVSFARALREYQQGARSEQDLFAGLDEALNDQRADPESLLATLDDQHTADPLPSALLGALRSRILEAPTSGAEGDAEDLEATELATSLFSSQPAADEPAAEATRAATQPPPAQPRAAAAGESYMPGPGDTLAGRFELKELIGQGGMSQVYLAIDKMKLEAGSRKPEVAIKLMDVSGPAADSAFIALQRETQKSQDLNHNNIVRVNDFYRDDASGALFITMEYLSGAPLSNKLRGLGGKGLPEEQAFDYIRQMGLALAHAHGKRIVHADFKPSNVFVTEDGVLKVIDFGIARASRKPDDDPQDMTVFDPRELGALTPAYASPEMIEHHPADERDDVYSLGCVAYELLTGRHPFARASAVQAREGGMTPARPPGLSRSQWQALRGALAFERDSRTPTVDAFLEGLLPASRPLPSALLVALGAAAGVAVWFFYAQPLEPPALETPVLPMPQESLPAPVPQPIPEVEPPAQPVVQLPEAGDAIVDCADCPKLIVLAPGSVTVGDDSERAFAFEAPAHQVVISAPIAISETEVTVAEFRRYVEAKSRVVKGCGTVEEGWSINQDLSWQNPGFEQSDEHPVTCVSWQDARDYVSWLSEMTGERYRLPSEAEWEFAARSGEDGATAEEALCRYGNVADESVLDTYPGFQAAACDDGHAFTAPVASFDVNGPGLYDLRGNLFEWAADCWNDSYDGAPSDGRAWDAGDCDQRVLRGGSWFTAPSEQRLSFRNRHPRGYRANTFGFRVVRELGG